MRKKLLIAAGILVGVVALFIAFLPQILSLIGFHPHYDRVEYDLAGTQALIIATNHDTLGDPETGSGNGGVWFGMALLNGSAEYAS